MYIFSEVMRFCFSLCVSKTKSIWISNGDAHTCKDKHIYWYCVVLNEFVWYAKIANFRGHDDCFHLLSYFFCWIICMIMYMRFVLFTLSNQCHLSWWYDDDCYVPHTVQRNTQTQHIYIFFNCEHWTVFGWTDPWMSLHDSHMWCEYFRFVNW